MRPWAFPAVWPGGRAVLGSRVRSPPWAWAGAGPAPSARGLGMASRFRVLQDVVTGAPRGLWVTGTFLCDLLLPPCCPNPRFLGARFCSCGEMAQAQGCRSPAGPRGPGAGVALVSGADCILGAESPRPPPPNSGEVHQFIFLSFCFVKKIAISPCPFSWPLMEASPPSPGPRREGCGGGEGIGCSWWAG